MDGKTIAIVAGCVLAGGVFMLTLLSLTARQPTNLGVTGGQLAPCPDKPNCVSTRATEERHRIEPLTYDGTAGQAMARLQAVLSARPRIHIVTRTDTYLHAECTSRVFRFVDDVEFLLDREGR
jgi:uncharacterized protein (DUF1499 family)